MKLPYLEDSRWPGIKKTEERTVNPSYDHQLQNHLIEELLSALEHKDHKSIVQALQALYQSIHSEEVE